MGSPWESNSLNGKYILQSVLQVRLHFSLPVIVHLLSLSLLTAFFPKQLNLDHLLELTIFNSPYFSIQFLSNSSPKGVTGAGKTSLLDTLAHRTTSGVVKGDIRLGSVVPDANFQRKIGYVQQEDIHLPTTTVREALEFSARLRRPDDGTANRLKQVLRTLDLLEMTRYADAVVGVPGEGMYSR